jgi:hypothetical protein
MMSCRLFLTGALVLALEPHSLQPTSSGLNPRLSSNSLGKHVGKAGQKIDVVFVIAMLGQGYQPQYAVGWTVQALESKRQPSRRSCAGRKAGSDRSLAAFKFLMMTARQVYETRPWVNSVGR